MIKAIIAFMCLVSLCAIAYAAPTLTSASISGDEIILSGSSFGEHADYNPSKSYLVYVTDNFDDGVINGNFTRVDALLDLTTSGQRTGSTYCVERTHATNSAGFGMSSSSVNEFFTCLWIKRQTDTIFEASGQNKIVRIFTEDEGSSPYPNFTVGKKEFDGDRNHSDGVENSGYGASFGYTTLYDDAAWHKVVVYFQPSTGIGVADGVVKVWFDDVLVRNVSNADTDDLGVNSYLGSWDVMGYYKGADKDCYYDDVTFNHTLARVRYRSAAGEVSDIQIPTSWSATAIECDINRAEVGGEVQVIDSNGDASSWVVVTGNSSVKLSNIKLSNITFN